MNGLPRNMPRINRLEFGYDRRAYRTIRGGGLRSPIALVRFCKTLDIDDW